MGLHQLGHDLVLARELGFELLDFLVLGIFDGLGLAAILEEDVAILEELVTRCSGLLEISGVWSYMRLLR